MSLSFAGPPRPASRREEEGRKLIELLDEVDMDTMTPRDREFYQSVLDGWPFTPSEAQIAWLRDLRDRYL